jgi:AraC-like DNA-binding protein
MLNAINQATAPMRKLMTRGFPRTPCRVPAIVSEAALLPSEPLPWAWGDGTACAHPASQRDSFARIGLRCDEGPERDAPFEVDVSLSLLPGLQMAAGRLYGACCRRTRALLDSETDDAALIVNMRGRHLIEQCGREIALGEGEAVLVSWTEPSRLTHLPPSEALALRFPRTRLAPLLPGPDARYMRPIRGGEALDLLMRYVALAWDEPTTGSPQLQRLMASHIYDLMAVLIGATLDAARMAQLGGLQAARLVAIKEDIERSLDRASLCVAAVAGRHGCTPRCVQRLFEAEGTTFTAYVLGRRLARAHGLLTDPRHATGKIIAVAHACGFGDVSYFNRAFRRQFGLAPSDVRARAREGAAGT